MKNMLTKTAFAISFLILSNISAIAQEGECNCSVAFSDLTSKLERNYIGLALIQNTEKRNNYESRKMEFGKVAATVKAQECSKFLQNFLTFFEDEHLFVVEYPKYSEETLARIKAEIKENKKSTERILHLLENQKEEAQTVEGIIGKWTDGQSEFAIIKDEGYYKAYVIDSKTSNLEEGELKAEFKASEEGFEGTYYSYSYSPRYVQGNIYKEGTLLVLTGGLYWGKVGTNPSREIAMINKEEINLPTIAKLDEENTLLSIPSFLTDPQKFNNVLITHLDLLKNTTNLIIDIRGNVGGNALYFAFLDAYATHTLKGNQGLVLASDETLAYFQKLATNAPEVYSPVVDRIRNNMGKITEGPLYPDTSFPPFESKIMNVAILTDGGCKSASESFILHSKGASSKVTTFGSPTGGVIDYTSINSLKIDSGNQNIYFGYPTGTYNKEILKNGYNSTGIVPDMPIHPSEKDKVAYIVQYYKKQNSKE